MNSWILLIILKNNLDKNTLNIFLTHNFIFYANDNTGKYRFRDYKCIRCGSFVGFSVKNHEEIQYFSKNMIDNKKYYLSKINKVISCNKEIMQKACS